MSLANASKSRKARLKLKINKHVFRTGDGPAARYPLVVITFRNFQKFARNYSMLA